MGKIVSSGNQRFLIENGKVYPIVATRNYGMVTPEVLPAPAPLIEQTFVTQKKYDQMKKLADAAGVDVPAFIAVYPKRASTSVRAARATGTYHCEFFGHDYVTITQRIHHPNDCGLDKTGNFTSAKRLAGHLAWCSDAPADVIKKVKAAKS